MVPIQCDADVGELRVAVASTSSEHSDEEGLSPLEREYLTRRSFGPARKSEWTAGRITARRILARNGIHGGNILASENGAPRWIHPTQPLQLSVSHDGPYVALAWTKEPNAAVGVDVCLSSHQASLDRILRRFRITYEGCDSVSAWASLECVIKIGGKRIGDVLDDPPRVVVQNDTAVVELMGQEVSVHLRRHECFALAWGQRPRKAKKGAKAGEN